MTMVFADTFYWVAVFQPNSSWREPAKRARESLGNVRLLTTDEVLNEFLAAMSKHGEHYRREAVREVRAILADPNVTIVPQSHVSFLRGVDLYGKRLDKEYSLTDCISMNAMREKSVTKVLTHDHHFAQEGFEVLIASEQKTD
jgi:predicted nucleic acid-binding protein